MTWPTRKIGEMKKAWLVQWGFHAQDEEKSLRKIGIRKKVIDIISARKKFEEIVEIAKDVYMREMLSFSEKLYLSNYSQGKRRRDYFFDVNIPVFTHYKSNLYRNLIKQTEKDIKSKKLEQLREEWKKYPEYIIIGHNPYIKIQKVFNFSVSESKNGNEVLEWDYQLANGSGNLKRGKYEIKK